MQCVVRVDRAGECHLIHTVRDRHVAIGFTKHNVIVGRVGRGEVVLARLRDADDQRVAVLQEFRNDAVPEIRSGLVVVRSDVESEIYVIRDALMSVRHDNLRLRDSLGDHADSLMLGQRRLLQAGEVHSDHIQQVYKLTFFVLCEEIKHRSRSP